MLPVPHISLEQWQLTHHARRQQPDVDTCLRYALVETHPPIKQHLVRWNGGWINDEDDYYHDNAVIQVVKLYLKKQ